MQSSSGPQRSGLAILVLISLLAVGVGLWVGKSMFQRGGIPLPQSSRYITVLPEPRPLEAFSLTDHHGQPFTRDSLKGQWTFMFFGYTHCPDVCPNTLSMLNLVAKRLAAAPAGRNDVRFVFISVDPERDSIEQLAQYVPYFNKEFVGATGTPDQIKALSRPMGVMYMRAPGSEAKENYLVDHSSSIMLLDPRGEWHAMFPAPHDVAGIVEEFTKLRGN